MAYRNFTLQKLEKEHGIVQRTGKIFQEPITPVEPPAHLLFQLELASESALTTEKALSEAIVFPILQAIKWLNKAFIEVFSGEILLADAKAGLNGEADFLIALAPGSKYLKSPIIAVTEAKQGEIQNPKNLAQTCAQMLGSRIFNQNHDTPHPIIFGACTSGSEWLFMKLEDQVLLVEPVFFSIKNLPELLGVLQQIIDVQKAPQKKITH